MKKNYPKNISKITKPKMDYFKKSYNEIKNTLINSLKGLRRIFKNEHQEMGEISGLSESMHNIDFHLIQFV